MNRFWIVCAAVILASGIGLMTVREAATAAAPAPTRSPSLTNDETNNIEVFQAASPSVVFVTNTQLRRQRFSLNVLEIPKGSGTGFVWDKSGLIVTNYHVIWNAAEADVTFLVDGGTKLTRKAQLRGVDPDKDIAVLKVDDMPKKTLKPIAVGTSANLKDRKSVV